MPRCTVVFCFDLLIRKFFDEKVKREWNGDVSVVNTSRLVLFPGKRVKLVFLMSGVVWSTVDRGVSHVDNYGHVALFRTALSVSFHEQTILRQGGSECERHGRQENILCRRTPLHALLALLRNADFLSILPFHGVLT